MNCNCIASAQIGFQKPNNFRGHAEHLSLPEEEVGEMGNRLPRCKKVLTSALGAATLLWLAGVSHAQSSATQSSPTQSPPAQTTPAQSAPTQSTQPSAAEERQPVQSNTDRSGMTNGGQDRDRRDVASFDRFLDDHREIGEQVRKDPSLLDNPKFVHDHPALQTYLQANPGVRDQLRQDPNAFMHQADLYARDANMGDRNAAGQDRDAYRRDVSDNGGQDHRDVANFDRFLDNHREIGEQVRKDPSLLDNPKFVHDHPALQTYFQDNPGVRDQLRQNPNAFMHQVDVYARNTNGNPDAMHDHMADFGGWLRSHPDIQKDVSKDPSCVKDHQYVQDHAELDAYLNAHPDVRDDLMSNPQGFVHGAQQFNNGGATGAAGGTGVNDRGAGVTGGTDVNSHGMGTTGSSTTGTSTNPSTTTHDAPKPAQ
jgi:hypothetical protein